MEKLIVIIVLAMLSIEDLLKKKISILPCLFFIVLGIFLAVYREKTFGPWLIVSFVPGLLVLGISAVSRGRIGIGDGLCLMITSLILGINGAVFSFFLSLLIVGIIGEILILTHKIKKGASLPFIPFLFLGTVVSLII